MNIQELSNFHLPLGHSLDAADHDVRLLAAASQRHWRNLLGMMWVEHFSIFFGRLFLPIFSPFFFRFYAYFSGDPFNAYVNSNISCPRPKPPCPVGSHWVRSWDSHRQCPATGASTFGQPKLGYFQPKLGMQPSLSNKQLDTSTETTKILGRLPNLIPKTSTICCFTVAPLSWHLY